MIVLGYVVILAILAFLAAIVALFIAAVGFLAHVASAADKALDLLDEIWDELSLANALLREPDDGDDGEGGDLEVEIEKMQAFLSKCEAEGDVDPQPAGEPEGLLHEGRIYCTCPACLSRSMPN